MSVVALKTPETASPLGHRESEKPKPLSASTKSEKPAYYTVSYYIPSDGPNMPCSVQEFVKGNELLKHQRDAKEAGFSILITPHRLSAEKKEQAAASAERAKLPTATSLSTLVGFIGCFSPGALPRYLESYYREPFFNQLQTAEGLTCVVRTNVNPTPGTTLDSFRKASDPKNEKFGATINPSSFKTTVFNNLQPKDLCDIIEIAMGDPFVFMKSSLPQGKKKPANQMASKLG